MVMPVNMQRMPSSLENWSLSAVQDWISATVRAARRSQSAVDAWSPAAVSLCRSVTDLEVGAARANAGGRVHRGGNASRGRTVRGERPIRGRVRRARVGRDHGDGGVGGAVGAGLSGAPGACDVCAGWRVTRWRWRFATAFCCRTSWRSGTPGRLPRLRARSCSTWAGPSRWTTRCSSCSRARD